MCIRDRVNSAWKDRQDLDVTLSRAVLYLFKFRKFVDSRWCTVGPACRTLCCALAVGLDGLVGLIRGSGNASDYYIHGYERLAPEVRKYTVVAAIASFVPDSFLIELLEDDRVARRVGVLQATMTEEQQWIDALPALVWCRMPALSVSEWGPAAMRSSTVHAGMVA
eukprot:899122-Alexandrium_andersonii.AAC.1